MLKSFIKKLRYQSLLRFHIVAVQSDIEQSEKDLAVLDQQRRGYMQIADHYPDLREQNLELARHIDALKMTERRMIAQSCEKLKNYKLLESAARAGSRADGKNPSSRMANTVLKPVHCTDR